MDDRLERLESRVQQLETAIRNLAPRLDALEDRLRGASRGAEGDAAATALPPVREPAAPQAQTVDHVGALSLVGRTFMVMAGAYLLRALTESGALPNWAGIALGLAYAITWTIAADRAGQQRPLSAVFHGLASVMIAFPILWEATAKFKLFSAPVSAAALATVAALMLTVAWRRSLRPVAWFATLGALATAIVLFAQTGAIVPYAFVLIALGVGTLWLGYDREWVTLRWPVAIVADVVVVGLTSRALAGHESPGITILVQLLLLSAYLASVAARTLVKGRDVIPFEIAQTAAGLVIGLGGAIAIVRSTATGSALLGTATVAIGAACYGVAFAFLERRQRGSTNFYFYISLAIVLVLTGTAVLLSPPVLAAVWAVLAVLTTWWGQRFSRVSLTWHGAIYAVAAAFVTGLLASSLAALVAPAGQAWPAFSPAAWVVLVAVAICALIPFPTVESGQAALPRSPRVIVDVVLLIAVSGALVHALAPLVGAQARTAAGRVATLRTAVLSAGGVALAVAGSRPSFVEFGWLLYPVLALGGLKLLTEDLRVSTAGTLFLALACLGAALILAPRLLRTARSSQ